MAFFLQLTMNGLAAGAIYALMAVGFALIYSATRIFHVAHGAVFTVAAYAMYTFVKLLGLPVLVASLLSLLIATGLGVAVEVWCYRPLRARSANLAAFMIGSFGVFIVLQNVMALLFGVQEQPVRDQPFRALAIGPAQVTTLHLMVFVACAVVFPLLHLFLTRTAAGKAVRALADNPDLATTVGLPTDRIYLAIAALGSALAGVAAPFVALDVGVALDRGFSVLLVACVAAIIGGVGHLPGAGIAAFLLGLVQNWSVFSLSPQWQDAVAFAILAVFLVVRPEGLFGEALALRKT